MYFVGSKAFHLIVQTYFPQKLAPSRYDAYLAAGWFRGSIMLYKMDLLCVEDDLFSVVNIRLNLEDYQPKKRLSKLLRKNEDLFEIAIGPAQIDEERERLYDLQRPKFKGFIHSTLNDYLHSGFFRTVFNTWEVAVYDGTHLAAVSYFDLGENSVASLIGLIDPDYQKFSLGIYTMLQELNFSKSMGKRWYYPGYILDKQSSFSYKLRLGEFEYYNANRRWSKIANYNPEESVAFKVKSKISALVGAFEKNRLWMNERLYPYFSMGYMYSFQIKFVRYPVLINTGIIRPNGIVFTSYDLEHDSFAVIVGNHAEDYSQLVNMEMSLEYGSNIYFNDLLEEVSVLGHFPSPEEAAVFVRSLYTEQGN